MKNGLWATVTFCIALATVFIVFRSELGHLPSQQISTSAASGANSGADSNVRKPTVQASSPSTSSPFIDPRVSSNLRSAAVSAQSGPQRDVSYFLGFTSSDSKSKVVSNLDAVLKNAKGIREFAAGENPSAPGCYKGDFRSEESGVVYDVLFGLLADGSPAGQIPGTPWMRPWKIGAGFLSVSANDGSHWETAFKNGSRFIVVSDNDANGFFLTVSEMVTLQIFPKLVSEHRFEYLGNAYMKDRDGHWRVVGEFDLKAAEMKYCINAQDQE
jgi:hypothetical protein